MRKNKKRYKSTIRKCVACDVIASKHIDGKSVCTLCYKLYKHNRKLFHQCVEEMDRLNGMG